MAQVVVKTQETFTELEVEVMLQACLSENLYTTQHSLESKTKVVGTINSYGPFIDRANPLTVKQLDNKVGSLLKTFEARYTSEKANVSASERSTIDRCLYDISQGKKKRRLTTPNDGSQQGCRQK
jgi:hypothetical protein